MTFDYENPPSRLQMLIDIRVYAATAWRVAVLAVGCYFVYLSARLVEFPIGFNPAGLWAVVNMAASAAAGIATLVFFWLFVLEEAIRAWELFWFFARDADEAQARRHAKKQAEQKRG